MQPEDKIYWGEQLEKLPTLIRSAVIAIRLGGQTVIILALISVLIGMQLGLFRDQAAKDREVLIAESKIQSEELRVSRKLGAEQLDILKEHVRSTKALVLVVCANLPSGSYERTQCLDLLK